MASLYSQTAIMIDNPKTLAIKAALNSDWETAIDLNLEILKTDVTDIDSLNRLGRAYVETGDYKKATTYFKKVLKIDKYHPIALKNLERLESMDKRKAHQEGSPAKANYNFLEEPGKTKIVTLVNISDPKIIATLRPATPVFLKLRRHTMIVCLESDHGPYIGALPDDLGHRLDILMEGGNIYESFIKAATSTSVTVFIRELFRGKKYKAISSFSPNASEKLVSVTNDEIEFEEKDEQTKKVVVVDDDEDDTPSKSSKIHADEEPDS